MNRNILFSRLSLITIITAPLCINSFIGAHSRDEYQWDSYTATREIDRLIDDKVSYWGQSLSDYEGSRDVINLKRKLKDEILESSDNYVRLNGSSVKIYSRFRVPERTMTGIIEFIQEKGYQYALKRTGNSAVARRAIDRLTKNLLRDNDRNLSLAGYVGSSLKSKVRDILHHIEYVGSSPAPAPATAAAAAAPRPLFVTYPSDECCVCLDGFDNSSHERMFLKPCGHDMCVTCYHRWVIEEKNRSCPLCRAHIHEGVSAQSISYKR